MTTMRDIPSLAEDMHFRPVKDDDAEALYALVGACYSEYQGVVLERQGIDSDLEAYASYVTSRGGEAYIVEQDEGVIACAAFARSNGVYELKRMYLRQDKRGSGLAAKLLSFIEARVREKGANVLHAWSDTRFERAHHFYQREGYQLKTGVTRFLHDISNSTEIQFIKNLSQ